MELFIGEHGEAIIYGIIGAMVVTLICVVCADKWKGVTPSYRSSASHTNREFMDATVGKYPVIETDEALYVDKGDNFDYRDYIKAKDCDGKDISSSLKVYGKYNVSESGIYRLKCVATADNNLSAVRYVNVVVE